MRERFPSHDRKGIEGYPLQLMIVVIILGITLPIIFSAFDYYQRENDRKLLEREVSKLKIAIIQVYNQGPGSVQYVTLDLPDTTEYLKVGGSLQDKERIYLIEFKIQNFQNEIEVINDGHKSIPTTARDHGTLYLTGGRYTIRIEKKLYDGDLNGDGVKGDAYIELLTTYAI